MTQRLNESDFSLAEKKNKKKTDQQLHFLLKLLVVFQVLHCCTSYSLYTQCSLTVSSAEATAQVYGVSSIALELFSYTPVPKLPMLITDCCLASQHPLCPRCTWRVCVCVCRYICSLGRERRCGDQVTEAHYSNDHLIVKERRFFLFILQQP